MEITAPSETPDSTARPGFWRRPAVTQTAHWVGGAALMLVLSLTGMRLESWSDRLIVGWPINAVALGWLLQSRTARWPGLAAMFAVAGAVTTMAHGKHLPVAAMIALVNSTQVLVFAGILRRLLGERIDLGRYRDLWFFTLFAGLILPLSSICLLTFIQPQHRALTQSLPGLARWAVGASLGYLVVTPTMFAWAPDRFATLIRLRRARRVFPALLAYTAAVMLISVQSFGELRILLVPALLWLTFQVGSAGATIGLVIQAVVLTACVLLGLGPVAPGETAADRLAMLQLGLVLNALCAYPVAAALAQRWRLGQSLVESNASLEQAHKLTQLAEQVGGIGYVHFDLTTGKDVFSEHFAQMMNAAEGPTHHSIHPDDLERAQLQKTHAILTGEDYESFVRVRSKDGGWRILRSRTSCQKDAEGKVTALVGVMIDVTDLELADQALRASESRYRLLAENSNDLIMLTDQEDQLVYASPAALTLTGYTPEELMNRTADISLPRLLHPDEFPRAIARFEALRRGEQLDDFTYRLRHRDGRWIWLETRTAVLRDPESGAVTGGMHVARDVTERKAMEAELERKCADAEAANRAKSEFLANMSHEIRTPLNGVMGVAGALARTTLDVDQREMVSLIETSAKTLETLLSDILDLARIEAGKMEIKPEPFDLARSVNACVSLFEAAAKAKGLTLDQVVEPAALGVYSGDAARIRQILCNLLGNAVKFTGAGGVTLTVAAHAGETASELRFDVRDTGIGFDAETKARLFSRFEQADGSITRKFGGSGLGLSISRSLAEAMGGRLVADATPGDGAVFTFTVSLPRSEGAIDAAGGSFGPSLDDDPLPGKRILLAEDHPANRRVVQLILGAAGVELTCVENGMEAVEAFVGGVFDLILMDMQMPVMDGLTAIGEIRKHEAASGAAPTPVLVLTANAMPEHFNASRAVGADGHITKPIQADILLERVSEIVGERAVRQVVQISA